MKLKTPIKAINLDEKAFIFGGAYGNLQATQAVLKKATELGFQKSEIVFTGDMVAYCANPVETVELIRLSVGHIIMGNCEEAIANNSSNCGCGFEEGTTCSALSNQWYNFCLSKMTPKMANWMGSLPKHLVLTLGGFDFLATHGSPSSINQFIFPSNLGSWEDTTKFDGYIVGHSGIPFIGEVNNKPWLNSGACGMPANDGTPRIWFATINSNLDKLIIETHSLEYDFSDAQTVMREASLKNGYMDCLANGIWPSHDVLPAMELSQTGLALLPQKKAFKRTPLRNLVSV